MAPRQTAFFYMLCFREPGVAEAAFGADLRAAVKRCFSALSGDAPENSWTSNCSCQFSSNGGYR